MSGSTPVDPRTTPSTLLVAAAAVSLQGLALVALGVIGLLDIVPSRVEVGLSVAVFFAAYGVGLLACAFALSRCRSWARGPVLLTQLIELGVAWNSRENVLLALVLAALAVVTIVAMVHPTTIRVLVDDPTGSLD